MPQRKRGSFYQGLAELRKKGVLIRNNDGIHMLPVKPETKKTRRRDKHFQWTPAVLSVLKDGTPRTSQELWEGIIKSHKPHPHMTRDRFSVAVPQMRKKRRIVRNAAGRYTLPKRGAVQHNEIGTTDNQ